VLRDLVPRPDRRTDGYLDLVTVPAAATAVGPADDRARPVSSGDLAEIAAAHGLAEVGIRPHLGTYLRDLWSRREFIGVLATSKAYAKNQGSYLGQLWTAVNPTLNALIYTAIFGFMLGTRRGLENVVAFIIVGVFTFRLTEQSISAGARAIDGNITLVRSLQFPRAVLPLSVTLTGLALFVPTAVVMLAFSFGAGFLPGMGAVPVTWSWLLVPLAVALLTVFNTGVALFMARLASGAPDLVNVLPFVTRLVMYGSGVLFSIEHYVARPAWLLAILEHQPVAVYLRLVRMCLLDEPSIPFDGTVWIWAAGWALVALAVGFFFFWRAEERYGRD
jgi:teichoic acid transport system permease protein